MYITLLSTGCNATKLVGRNQQRLSKHFLQSKHTNLYSWRSTSSYFLLALDVKELFHERHTLIPTILFIIISHRCLSECRHAQLIVGMWLLRAALPLIFLLQQRPQLRLHVRRGRRWKGLRPEKADHRLSASTPSRPVYTSASRLCLRLAHIFVLLRLNSSDVYFASLELWVSGD